MGQTPSCMPAADPMRKRVNKGSPASDGPMTQTMARIPSSRGTSPTQRRASPSSFTFSPSSPPSPLSLTRKALTIDPDMATATPSGLSPSSSSSPSHLASASSASSASSVRSLFHRLSTRRDTRQWVASTPTGADALRFRHFCPICYRHHASVLVTACCQHNICGECTTTYLRTKLPHHHLPLALLPHVELPTACPNCNQQQGVRFQRLSGSQEERSYVESPRTAALIKQQQQQQHQETELSARQVEGVAQLQQEGSRMQQFQAVMA